MVRGGPIRRTRDVRVRLTPDEHAAWIAARDHTGRRELGAWVRAVINEILTLPRGDRPGRPIPREQPLDVALYSELIRVANDIQQLARWASQERRYPAEQQVSSRPKPRTNRSAPPSSRSARQSPRRMPAASSVSLHGALAGQRTNSCPRLGHLLVQQHVATGC